MMQMLQQGGRPAERQAVAAEVSAGDGCGLIDDGS